MNINTAANVKAPAEAIWSVLMDFSAYPEWNPFIVEVHRPKPNLVSALIDLDPEERYIRLEAKLIEQTELSILRCKLLLGLPGILEGRYLLRVTADDASNKVEQELAIKGALRSVYLDRILEKKVRRGLNNQIAALKRRCESIAVTTK